MQKIIILTAIIALLLVWIPIGFTAAVFGALLAVSRRKIRDLMTRQHDLNNI
jgi:membrane glycosyltransferase